MKEVLFGHLVKMVDGLFVELFVFLSIHAYNDSFVKLVDLVVFMHLE